MKVLKTVFWTVTVIICLTIVAGNFAEFQLNSYEDVTPTELLVLQKLEGEELDICTGDYSLVTPIGTIITWWREPFTTTMQQTVSSTPMVLFIPMWSTATAR